MSKTNNRSDVIIRASVVGIAVNVLLAGMKAVIGIITNSIAIVLDAVNNLSDALSSLITIIGTRLAGKHPDKEHPLGYGRIEYLSALIISAIVLYAGITSFVESVKKILHPEPASYSTVSLLLLAAAVAAKILLGLYMKKTGAEVHSGSLEASGADALNDAIISSSVIASALLYIFTGVQLEPFVGAVISIMIIKSGIELIRDTLDEILGKRLDPEISRSVKQTITGHENVFGAYDLIVHSYGPDVLIGSVHIEVPDIMTAKELDELERRITADVMEKHGIILTGISVYSRNTGNDSAAQIRSEITRIVMTHEGVLQMHGFYLNEKEHRISFDVVMEYRKDQNEIFQSIQKDVRAAFPDYDIRITLDNDLSD